MVTSTMKLVPCFGCESRIKNRLNAFCIEKSSLPSSGLKTVSFYLLKFFHVNRNQSNNKVITSHKLNLEIFFFVTIISRSYSFFEFMDQKSWYCRKRNGIVHLGSIFLCNNQCFDILFIFRPNVRSHIRCLPVESKEFFPSQI